MAGSPASAVRLAWEHMFGSMRTRDQIKSLLATGYGVSDIARRLRLAEPTVAYHAGRILQPPPMPAQTEIRFDASAREEVPTRRRVELLLNEGHSRLEIARRLGLSKSTVSYHARRLGAPRDERGARRYDWGLVQRFYDDGHSVRQCQQRFGFSRQSWHAAVKRGAIAPRPHGLPLDQLLTDGVHRGRRNIKVRLISSGAKLNRCENCGIHEWLGAPLSLALHHVNGDRRDNRLENLELLCPNCHSQTDNFAGRRRSRPAPVHGDAA